MRNDVEGSEARRKGSAIEEISSYHYQRLIESESYAEDAFLPIRNELRVERLRQTFELWRSQTFNGQGPTFEELEEFVRNNVFTTRNP
jgi:hypothetical protein